MMQISIESGATMVRVLRCMKRLLHKVHITMVIDFLRRLLDDQGFGRACGSITKKELKLLVFVDPEICVLGVG